MRLDENFPFVKQQMGQRWRKGLALRVSTKAAWGGRNKSKSHEAAESFNFQDTLQLLNDQLGSKHLFQRDPSSVEGVSQVVAY
jgi:hypothetical protein